VVKETTDIPQPRSINDLQPKMCLQGTVKQTQLYGAVMDIGLECDGVVHISQLAPERVNRVTDVVKPGDNVTVWVTKVNPEKRFIGLTMIEPPRVDWHDLAENQVHTGTVIRLESYGAFVDIGAKRPGLLHIREMASGYVRHSSELVQLNEEVQVRILRIDLTMMGIEAETEDKTEEEEPTQTSMEMALKRRHDKHQVANLSEREDILARTLEQHSKRQ